MSLAARRTAIELFDEASKRTGPERAAFLDAHCAGEPGLRREVESLLSHFTDAAGFMTRGLFDRALANSADPLAGRLATGTRVSRYTVQRVLGEGGMGVVYLAQQEHPRRSVALKVIRPAAATPGMLRRFVREAELLGRLQHPGIAQIFEAGTADLGAGGIQPFLAMELVEGEPLTDHARGLGLHLRDRLILVSHLCEAVEHAHQRGLIHRDLKPANILVDARGQPKILDFGIARAVDSAAPGVTLATEVGTLIGTLAYMSPEQISGDPAAVDTRSDVYGLGVILYELVCLRRPLDTGDLGLFEAARRIREVEPERPGLVRRELRGDVETIILKAMAKDRERRYPSAAALREDLRRFLAGEPIMARQDSALYVLRKTIRRHRGLVGAAVVAVAGLAAFGVYASIQSGREREARLKADSERDRADAAASRLADELHVSNISRARWLLDNGSFPAAEDTLWREQLQRPGSAQAHWALRDLYSRHPTILSLPTSDTASRVLAVSADASLIAGGEADGRVSVFRLVDGAPVCSVRADAAQPWGAAFHPGAALLATIGREGVLRIWDLTDPGAPSLAAQAPAHTGTGHALAYTPDGGLIATAGMDGTIGLFDGRTAAPVRRTRPPDGSGRLHCVAFDDAGARLAIGGDGGHVYVTAVDAVPDKVSALARVQGDIQSVAFTHDGRRLLVGTGGAATAVHVLDSNTGAPERRIESTDGTVRSLDVSADDRLVLVNFYWRSDAFDLATGAPALDALSRPRGGFRARFLHGLRYAATSCYTGDVRVWELAPSPRTAHLRAHQGYIGKLCACDDGSRVMTVSADGSAAVWDTRSWTELLRVSRSRGFHSWVGALSPDGRTAAVVGRTGPIRLMNVPVETGGETGAVLAEFPGLRGMSADCVFTADGARLMVASTDGQLLVWNVPERRLERELRASGTEVFRIARVVGGGGAGGEGSSLVAIGQRGGSLPIWDVAAGALAAELPTEVTSFCLAVSPDAALVAVGQFHGEVQVWDRRSGSVVHEIVAHAQTVLHMAFSGDGRVLATTAGDGAPKLWDVETGQFLARLGDVEGAAGYATNLMFVPRSRVLIVTSSDGMMDAWDTAYFDRHIAGNVETAIRRLGPELGDRMDAAAVRAWARTLGPVGVPRGP